MRNWGTIVFALPLCLWIGIIFFDRVKSANESDISVTIYEDTMHGSSTVETKISDLEQQLAAAYETYDNDIKIEDGYFISEEDLDEDESVEIVENTENQSDENLSEEELYKQQQEEFLKLYYQSKEESENQDWDIEPDKTIETEMKEPDPAIPASYDLQNVIFYSQAPDGNWNEPYQNACEEASILLAYYYVTGKRPTKTEYKTDLLNLMAWEQNEFGHHKDTTIDEFLVLIKNFLGYNDSFLIINPTADQIKAEIAKGNTIIAPFRGQELYNPHYSGAGPYYHVMVIKGYDENNFITHDVGTSRGENRKYSIHTIMNALANGDKSRLEEPDSKIIVLEK